MSHRLIVALVQLEPILGNPILAQGAAETACRRSADMGADIAVLPEAFRDGYDIPDHRDEGAVSRWLQGVISAEDPWVLHFATLAQELEMAIAVTFFERGKVRPRNSMVLFDRSGKSILHYSKVHTCEFDRERLLEPGEEFPVAVLETKQGSVTLGAMICYDREFPESARLLMLAGAEIVLVPNACGIETHRRSQFSTRAFENQIGVAMANYAGEAYGGGSVAFSPICFTKQGESVDNCIAEGGAGEQIVLADFDMDAIREYRRTEVWGDCFRRPRLYEALVDNKPIADFLRREATR